MKYIFPLLIMLLFFGILIGANVYLARRFNYFFSIDRHTVAYIVFGFTTVYMLFGGMSTTNSTSVLGGIINVSAFTLLGFILYLLLSTILVDLVGLFVRLSPQIKGLAAIGLAIAISGYGIINARITRITSQDITINGLEVPLKAMHLTDTHLGHFRGGKNLRKLVDRINQENVDVVFFTGDLLDSRIQLKEESMAPLKALQAPVYFVEGNHDKYTGVDTIKDYLRSIGVNVLTNEVAEWNGIQIIGLNHILADSAAFDMHAQQGILTVQSALRTLDFDSSKPLILLHHGPAGIKYASQAGVDLYLAGHTHGGQMFPATLVAKAIFEYNKGLHIFENTIIHVCEGTGTFGPPMRVGTKSEMTVLNLLPSS